MSKLFVYRNSGGIWKTRVNQLPSIRSSEQCPSHTLQGIPFEHADIVAIEIQYAGAETLENKTSVKKNTRLINNKQITQCHQEFQVPNSEWFTTKRKVYSAQYHNIFLQPQKRMSMFPKKGPVQKEDSLPTTIFQGTS